MNRMSTRMMVEAGIMIALAQILSYVKIFEAPYGGSVTAGSMVPILIFGLRWGRAQGFVMAIAYGILQFILGPKYSFHIASILLDYAVAFGVLGIIGFFNKNKTSSLLGVFVAVFSRFIVHYISGIVLWVSTFPKDMNPYLYSALYNGAYLLPEFIISYLFILLLYKPLIQKEREYR